MPLPHGEEQLAEAMGLVPHPEGSYFVEVYRSGSTPMTTNGRTDLFCKQPERNMIDAPDAADWRARRPDGDARRNCISTIYYAPSKSMPMLVLSQNMSDHIHFYHGGRPFEYITWDPATRVLARTTLGPDLSAGHVMQLAVPGGTWKAGRLLPDDEVADEGDRAYEYVLIGEAVGPAFDFFDFRFVSEADLRSENCPDDVEQLLLPYIHDDAAKLSTAEAIGEYTAEFYRATWKKSFMRVNALQRLRIGLKK